MLLRLAPAFALVPAALAQGWPSPAFDAPIVWKSNNSNLMIEVLDHDGNGTQEILSVRLQWGGPGTAAPTFMTTSIDLPQTQQSSQVFAGYIGVLGYAPVPISAVGELWAADGAMEAVVAVGPNVQVVRNWVVTSFTVAGRVTGVAIGDFDGDGLGDLATLAELPTGNRELTVHRAQGTSSFVATTLVLPPTAGLLLVAAEIDGDAVRDLVVVGDRVQTWRWAGGALQQVHDLALYRPDPMPVAGDIDGDLDIDLVVFGLTDYVVLRRNGPASFQVEAPVAGGPATHLFDVDGDGDLDGACCSGGGGGILEAVNTPTTFRVSINNGGVFAPAYGMQGVGGWHLAGVTDLDGNGYKDLIAGRTIYFANQSLATPPQSTGPGNGTNAVAVFDADGDGDADVVSTPAALHRNQGEGPLSLQSLALLFQPAAGITFGPPVIPGDFDGDGDDDMIVEELTNGVPTGSRLLLQRGPNWADGGRPFPAGVALSPTLGNKAHPCVRADLDNDGDLDLALASTGPAYWSLLWFNNGAGAFTSMLLPNFVVVAAADFTGDNVCDLIVSDGRLMLKRGLGGGSFAGAEVLMITSWPYFSVTWAFKPFQDDLGVGDWNGDGRLDLIAGEHGFTSGCWPMTMLNTGGAVPPFMPGTPPVVAVSDALPVRIQPGDVDGDGHLDVVMGNPPGAFTNGSIVAFGTGGPSPLWDTNRNQEQVLSTTALADLDGDGDLDMIGGKLVRGRKFSGPTSGRRVQWGAGTPGLGGVTPMLGAKGRVQVGHALELRASGLAGLTVGLIGLGTSTWSVPAFGGTSYVDAVVLPLVWGTGAANVPGDGRASTLLPALSPTLAGLTIHAQGAFLDPQATLTLSNALTLRIGQ